MKTLKFDVFGCPLQVVKSASGWQAFYPGNHGKRRPARDIIIPDGLDESEIEQYLDDLCHEWANEKITGSGALTRNRSLGSAPRNLRRAVRIMARDLARGCR